MDTSQTDRLNDTPLMRALWALQPGESRILEATSADPFPAHQRLLRLLSSPHYTGGSVMWTNQPLPRPGARGFPHPPFVHVGSPAVPWSALERTPSIERISYEDYDDSGPIPHIYVWGNYILITQPVLDSLMALDPDSVDVLPVEIDEPPLPTRYYLCQFMRSLDLIDPRYTTVEIRSEAIPGLNGPIYLPRCLLRGGHHESEGYTVRDDIPASFHAIRNDYNGHILWSRELIEDMHSRGAVGICACRTEGYQSLSIVYNF